MQIDPSTVGTIDAKCAFDILRKSRLGASAGVVRDPK